MYESNQKLISQIKSKLKETLSENRYTHILSVVETACFIGKNHNMDTTKLTFAALLHDIAKNYTLEQLIDFCSSRNLELDDIEINNHGLLHGKVARIIAQEDYQIHDEDILNSISSHTTGRVYMSGYEEVIFVADYSEPSRSLHNSEAITEIALVNLSEAVFKVITEKLIYVIETGRTIHPRSIDTYNYYRTKINAS
ncbi:MAG: bis(5'-nucleosyl)-tetraphosphatase (symmetrical) YqeK [Spirochaetota bacterium]|nr:bis(5'-nucleosyl)-tetraphosphatase (symmetrical) YqeK [Spirochaetota bacterium]